MKDEVFCIKGIGWFMLERDYDKGNICLVNVVRKWMVVIFEG